MIDVFYTKIKNELHPSDYNHFLSRIPITLQERNLKFIRWNDRHANLFGKILLIEALKKYGYEANCLKLLKHDQYNRPFISPHIDFNISHSEEMVVCAIGEEVRLGIDVEKVRPVDFENFGDIMTVEQWRIIKNSVDPFKTFFTYWSIKESVIKADGRGLAIPLNSIQIKEGTAGYNNHHWFLKCLNLDDQYCCFIATNIENPIINIYYKEY